MIEQIYIYFTLNMIYLWLNIGVLPFWFILIFFPNSKINQIFVSSIFPLIILGCIYLYVVTELIRSGFNFIEVFNLYLGLEELRSIFGNKKSDSSASLRFSMLINKNEIKASPNTSSKASMVKKKLSLKTLNNSSLGRIK